MVGFDSWDICHMVVKAQRSTTSLLYCSQLVSKTYWTSGVYKDRNESYHDDGLYREQTNKERERKIYPSVQLLGDSVHTGFEPKTCMLLTRSLDDRTTKPAMWYCVPRISYNCIANSLFVFQISSMLDGFWWKKDSCFYS